MRPADLFDRSDRNDEEGGILEDIINRSSDVIDLVEASKKAKEESTRRQVLRIQARERDVKVRWVSYDPLAVSDTLGIPIRGPMEATHDFATEPQVRLLEKMGVTNAAAMSKRRANTMLDVLMRRRKENKATMKQVSWIIRTGCDPTVARAMSFDDAREYLDKKFGKRA